MAAQKLAISKERNLKQIAPVHQFTGGYTVKKRFFCLEENMWKYEKKSEYNTSNFHTNATSFFSRSFRWKVLYFW